MLIHTKAMSESAARACQAALDSERSDLFQTRPATTITPPAPYAIHVLISPRSGGHPPTSTMAMSPPIKKDSSASPAQSVENAAVLRGGHGFRRLTGGSSAASSEAKPGSESAAPAG